MFIHIRRLSTGL